MKLNEVVIGVGSNIDPGKNIKIAEQNIGANHKLIKRSSFIETEPIGYKEQDNFLNGAFLIETEMGLSELKSWLKDLEKQLGRTKTENRYGPRTIDLDIIVWNGKVVDDEVYEREFLLDSVRELLQNFSL
jgi:2-amino-4-hydroxy-6-hydroxymethyldihydropteridine diphosphokinase